MSTDDGLGEIASREEFDAVLAETMLDAERLRARPLGAKPTPMQELFDGLNKQLGKMAKFLEAGRKRSEREREEIHHVLEGVPLEGENPCPAIHDFRADLVGRLRRLNAYFRKLMSAPPYAEAEIRAVGTAFLRSVVLGGGARMAFVRMEGANPGLHVCRWEQSKLAAPDGPFQFSLSEYLPTSEGLLTLVPFDGREPTGVRWSPHNDWLAYRIAGADGQSNIGWCESREVGERGRVPGDAFTWTSQGESLVIADSSHKVVSRLNVRTRSALDLCAFHDDGDPVFPPLLTVAPGGGALVYTCRRVKEAVSEIWIIEFQGATPAARMLRRFPRAAVRALPFWYMGTLGYLAVDSDRGTSEIALIGTGESAKPEVLWRSDTAEPLRTPSASPTGRWIAFWRSAAGGEPGGLHLLDCDTREAAPLPLPAGVAGTPKFGDGTIIVEGDGAAHLIWLRSLPQKREQVERF